MAGLIATFRQTYDAAAKDDVWRRHSVAFRRFWCEKVLSHDPGPISNDECDAVIRILDVNGKGNTEGSEAVARVLTPQNVWRTLFNAFHTNRELATLVNSVFEKNELHERAAFIDHLHAYNKDNKNRLTGENATVLNVLLAAYDPVENLSVVSLNDRKSQIDFLKLQLPFDWRNASFGQRVAQSNALIRKATHDLGLEGTARTLSCFWYSEPVKKLWKPHETVSGSTTVSVTVPEEIKSESDGTADESDLSESFKVQATLAEIGTEMGFKIWLPDATAQGSSPSGNREKTTSWTTCP